MTRELPCPSSQRAAMVLAEIRAYTVFLFRQRVRLAFGVSVAESFDAAIRSDRDNDAYTLLYAEPVSNETAYPGEDPAPCTPQRTYELVRAARREAAPRRPFELTPEMVQRFCQMTGVHAESFLGGVTGLASLAFYVLVFSLLTSEGDPTRWQMNQLLKKLKACREDLSAKLDALIPEGHPPTPKPRPPMQVAAAHFGETCPSPPDGVARALSAAENEIVE